MGFRSLLPSSLVVFSSRLGFASFSGGLLFAAVSLFAVPAAFAKDAVPDWVRQAAATPVPAFPPETNSVILLSEETLTIDKDGRAVKHCREVIKILRPAGRDAGRVAVPFDNDSKILSLHIWSIAPDGHEYIVKDNEMREYGAATQGGVLYEDERFRVANPPARDPGGVIAFEYEQRLRPYDHEETWFFQDDTPRLKQSFTLELAPNFTYATVFAHGDALKTIDLEHTRYRWEADGTPGIDLEYVPLAPSSNSLASRMTVHYAPAGTAGLGTWHQVGQEYDQISRDRMASTPEIAAKAQALTAGKTDFYDKTEAIAEFVQKDIRYFVVEKGIGGLQPHPAAEIFHNRYGDCKDKSTLLSAMLSTVGIHSAIVLVDTERGFVDPMAPSILGNHAIAAVQIPDGYESPRLRSVVKTKTGRRYLIVDPTWSYTAFGQLEHNLQGGYAVLVEPGQSEVVQIPVLNPELNHIHRSAALELSADGMLRGSYSEARFGDLSERRRELFLGEPVKRQEEVLGKALSQDLVSFRFSDVKVENAQTFNKDLRTSFHLEADRYSRAMGSLLMVRPWVLGSDEFPLDSKPRKVPYDLTQAMQEQDEYTIKLPDGYTADELPEPVHLDLGFAAYESATSLKDNALHYSRTYTVREVTVPAARSGDMEKLARTISGDEQNRAVLKKKP